MRKGVVLSTVCLCAAICVGQEPWKFKWPAIIPAVQDYDYEAENPVALDADLTVEVFCADGSKAADWVAAKMSAWFGGLAFRAKDGQGGGDALPEGDEAYSLAAEKGRLKIRARTAKGVKWALMTLRQIAQPVRGGCGKLA